MIEGYYWVISRWHEVLPCRSVLQFGLLVVEVVTSGSHFWVWPPFLPSYWISEEMHVVGTGDMVATGFHMSL